MGSSELFLGRPECGLEEEEEEGGSPVEKNFFLGGAAVLIVNLEALVEMF